MSTPENERKQLVDSNDDIIDRPTSAPPQLGVINGNFFGYDHLNSMHNPRTHPSYEKYYESKISQENTHPSQISYLSNWLGEANVQPNIDINYGLFNNNNNVCMSSSIHFMKLSIFF